MMCADLHSPALNALAAVTFLASGLAILIWPHEVQRFGERIAEWEFKKFPFLRRVFFVHIWFAAWSRQLRVFPWLVRLEGLAISLVGLFLAGVLVIGLFNPCP